MKTITRPFTGSPQEVTATPDSIGLPSETRVQVLYNGSKTPPTEAGTYAVDAIVLTEGRKGKIIGGPCSLVIGKTSQTISSFSISDRAFSTTPFTVTPPTASSGLSVILTVKSGPATISGNTITMTGAGTVIVAANQAGNATYDAAPEVTASFAATHQHGRLLSGLQSWWDLSEASGTRVDSSGNEFHLFDNNSVSSSAQTIRGKTITAARFNGVDNYLFVAKKNILNNAPAFSAAAWVKPTGQNWFALVDDSLQLSTGHGGSDGANFYIPSSSGGVGWSNNTYLREEWHLLAMTYSPTDGLTGYIDGAFAGETRATTPLKIDTNGIHIGCNQDATYFTEGMNSMQGPSAVWTRTLSSSEIAELYNGGIPLLYSDL